MAKKKKDKKKKNIGEKLALILAGIILVPTIALTTCIVLAQTTNMDFDWLASKASAIEQEKEAEEAAKIAEEEAAALEKEQAAAEEEAAQAASSSSTAPTSVNVEVVNSTPAPVTSSTDNSTTQDSTTAVSADPSTELTSDNISVENDVTGESSAETTALGNLDDLVYVEDTNGYYHKKSSCSSMINPKQVTMQDALYDGKTPCPTCCK